VVPTTPEVEVGGRAAQELEQRLTDLGYVQGRNIVLLQRFSGPQPDKMKEVIISLVPQIDLLVVWGGNRGKEIRRQRADGVYIVRFFRWRKDWSKASRIPAET
jgi:hypothetical protein